MAEKYNSKVVLASGEVLIDLTSDTIDASHTLYGYTFHGRDGAPTTGTCTYDVDSSEATASVSEILATKTAAVNGVILTGTMPNRGSVEGIINTLSDYTIQQGYHDGSGTVGISSAEKAKIIASNIKDGVQILGVTGSYTGEGVTAQTKQATPTFSAQQIIPDTGYDYLSQVSIAPITVTYSDNSAGGKTVTIGAI